MGNNPDLYESFRQQVAKDMEQKDGTRGRAGNPTVYQLHFVKTACEISKTDLTEFFDQYGFFYVGNFELKDYGTYTYDMTEAMVEECKSAIKAMNRNQKLISVH